MELYVMNLSEAEVQVLRQALDVIQLNGRDAKFIANLQTRLETVAESQPTEADHKQSTKKVGS